MTFTASNFTFDEVISDLHQIAIDRPVSYDIYRNVHKAIREELFAVTAALGRVDPDDLAAGRRVSGHVRNLQTLLVSHAAHEDDFLDDAIERALGEHAAAIRASHVVLEENVERIAMIVDIGVDATGADRRAAFHMAYLELAAFVASYLQHQDDEERVVIRALDRTFSPDVLAGLDAQIVASIQPELMGRFLSLMLPAMNVLDRCELLADMRAHAPAEVFVSVWAMASQVLEPAEYLATAHRLDLAVERSPFE